MPDPSPCVPELELAAIRQLTSSTVDCLAYTPPPMLSASFSSRRQRTSRSSQDPSAAMAPPLSDRFSSKRQSSKETSLPSFR